MSPGKLTLPRVFTNLGQQYRILIGFSLITAAILVQQMAAFTVVNAFTRSLSNWMHIPMFAGITAVAMWIWPKTTWWKLAIGLMLLALATEGIQFYTGRLPSIEDLSKDCLGAGITWVCFVRLRLSNFIVWLLSVFIVTLAIPSTYLASYQYQQKTFPTLFTPNDWRSKQLTRVKATGGIITEHAWSRYKDKPVLAATWHQTRWPGLHIVEPISNWEAYAALRIDIFNAEPTPQPITVGVRHFARRGTARYRTIMLAPGDNEVRIALKDLAYLDDGKPAKIRHLMLYTTEEQAYKRVLIGRVWLE